MIREHPVQLLGHRAVEGAHARLDVACGDAGLRCGERAGERGVRVAVDEHQRGLQLLQHRLERRQDARRLGGVRAAAGVELAVGRRDAQLLEEDPRELVVVVLAGVDDQLVHPLPEQPRDRGRLHELGAVADYSDDPHGQGS